MKHWHNHLISFLETPKRHNHQPQKSRRQPERPGRGRRLAGAGPGGRDAREAAEAVLRSLLTSVLSALTALTTLLGHMHPEKERVDHVVLPETKNKQQKMLLLRKTCHTATKAVGFQCGEVLDFWAMKGRPKQNQLNGFLSWSPEKVELSQGFCVSFSSFSSHPVYVKPFGSKPLNKLS